MREPAPATKTCTNDGIALRAVEPSTSACTGTSRQPSTARPSSAAISSIRPRALRSTSGSPASPAKKPVPTA